MGKQPKHGQRARQRGRVDLGEFQARREAKLPRETERAGEEPKRQGLFSGAELLLVKKDLAAIWSRNSRRALLAILPLTLVVGIPAVYFVAILLLPVEAGASLPEGIRAMLPGGGAGLSYQQGWMVAFTQLICPLLFLCVPVLTAAASASYAFVTERESGTLETLLLTSMDIKAVFTAKVSSCTILSVFISGAAFAAFGATALIAGAFAEAPVFFNWEWLVILVLLMPTLSLFSVVFVALIVTRVHSTGESLETMGYLIVPLAGLYLAQLTGVVRLNGWVLLGAAVVLGVLDVVLYNKAGRGFRPENLLKDEEA